ncbi:hypothetical protein [Parapedobacter deserti]|uniref:hypothetical protein n=1 Tax=Parapedobacter deserti TaxID=1912957 RepID=UPI00366F63FB
MAKVFSILLILLYSVSSTGATIYLHYCCGTPQKIVLKDEAMISNHDECPLCEHHLTENEQGHCCDDDGSDTDGTPSHSHCQNAKIEAKKITEEHLLGTDKKLPKVYPLELFVFTLVHVIDLPSGTQPSMAIGNGPPDTSIPLFIQFSTYRI